jgi:ElaA protein
LEKVSTKSLVVCSIDMQFKLKKFNELNVQELYELLRLRNEVFVVEQNCAYQDLDDKDQEALHLMGFVGDQLAAYVRILKPGVSYKEAAIGRVVVSPLHRRKALGIELMKRAIEDCCNKFNTGVIVISAQKYLEKFYTDLGFVTESDVYLEDDIPHIKMRWIKQEGLS